MSHLPQRTEKNCLNCGTTVVGHFCHHCGQENIITNESFGSLLKHFVFDLLHFDGNFFPTVKYLFTRPGFIPKQYVAGKRFSYLHPVRMYLFTSALFFLVFFNLQGDQRFTDNDASKAIYINKEDRLGMATQFEKRIKDNPTDTVLKRYAILLRDTTKQVKYSDLTKAGVGTFDGSKYGSAKSYDSAQNLLSKDKRDGWLARTLTHKQIILSKKFNGNTSEEVTYLWEGFLHKMPYMLFISLPFFALILKLLYARRKSFYYSDHAVFTLYHYVFSFVLLLFIFLVNAIQNEMKWSLGILIAILIIIWPVYLYISMKRFYGQGGLKTFFKFLLLNLIACVLMLLLFIGFLLFSVVQIH